MDVDEIANLSSNKDDYYSALGNLTNSSETMFIHESCPEDSVDQEIVSNNSQSSTSRASSNILPVSKKQWPRSKEDWFLVSSVKK